MPVFKVNSLVPYLGHAQLLCSCGDGSILEIPGNDRTVDILRRIIRGPLVEDMRHKLVTKNKNFFYHL